MSDKKFLSYCNITSFVFSVGRRKSVLNGGKRRRRRKEEKA